MLKTLKMKERDILFEDKFLIDYYKHIVKNKDSLLSRLLGVYEIRAKKQSPLVFFITENMIGEDFTAIKRCWDLKGSLLRRRTETTPTFNVPPLTFRSCHNKIVRFVTAFVSTATNLV